MHKKNLTMDKETKDIVIEFIYDGIMKSATVGGCKRAKYLAKNIKNKFETTGYELRN